MNNPRASALVQTQGGCKQHSRWFRLLILLSFLMLVSHGLTLEARGQSAASPLLELGQIKAASGGAAWDRVTILGAIGEKVSFGLSGTFHLAEELAAGFFEARADYGIFANAEGLDAAGRCRQDNSGQVHALDSEEAQEVAVSESYLSRRGYFFPEEVPAAFRTLDSITECTKRFDRIVVAPTHGRSITLWIDSSTGSHRYGTIDPYQAGAL